MSRKKSFFLTMPFVALLFLFFQNKDNYFFSKKVNPPVENKTIAKTIKIEKSILKIDSIPDGALVFLNGKEKGTTPLKLNFLNKGVYILELKKKYHFPEKKSIILEKNKEKHISFSLYRGIADLDLSSVPEGADIFIDGQKIENKTPFVFKDFPCGEYEIEVVKKGYVKELKTVALTDDGAKKVVFELKPEGAEKPVPAPEKKKEKKKEPEKAEIIEEDIPPMVKEKKAVEKKEEKKEPVFKPKEVKKEVKIKEKIEEPKPLLKYMARLYVETVPDNSRISFKVKQVDFKNGMDLAPGEYEIKAEKEFFSKISKKLILKAGEEKRVKLIFKDYKDPLTGMEFKYIKGGCYQMGCFEKSLCSKDELPVHLVCLDGFWIGTKEVSQGEWLKIMDENPSAFALGKNMPVQKVSWDKAVSFTEKLSKERNDIKFRLPTEAEWEYCARDLGLNQKFAGSNLPGDFVWYSKNTSYPMERGSKQPNSLGLFDMSGNLFEWCLDSYDKDSYKKHSGKNPVNMNSSPEKVLRGGAWYSDLANCSVYNRSKLFSGNADYGVGFRVVMIPSK